jgi:hypothetical protein
MITRATAAAVVFAGVTLGLACPAWADELGGTYTFYGDFGNSTWTITSQCEGAMPGECTAAHVVSSAGWQGDARLINGLWTMTGPQRANLLKCDNGSFGPGAFIYSFDAVSLIGTVTAPASPPCRAAAGSNAMRLVRG